MTFTEAAALVLRLVGKPLHYKEITDVAIEKNLLSHVGKSPEVTMGARLSALVKKAEKDNPLVRVKPGVFALRDWDQSTIDKGLADRTPALQLANKAEAAAATAAKTGDNGAAELASAPLASSPNGSSPVAAVSLTMPDDDDEENAAGPDDDERARAELASSAAELFEAEDDDDIPIIGAGADEAEESADGDETDANGARRRRRRRRRGGRGDEREEGDLPGYTVSDAPVEGVEPRVAREGGGREGREPREAREAREPREPREAREGRDRGPREGRDREPREGRDRGGRDRGREERRDLPLPDSFDELQGKTLAEGLERLLAGQDRSAGTISVQRLAEAAGKGGKTADPGQLASLFLAAARADNLRRARDGERARFRVNGARLGLTEWSMDGDLLRLEKDIQQLTERYRESVRRTLQKKIADLPHRALGEFFLLLLERLGVSDLSPVRRAGAPAPEMHLSGMDKGAIGDTRTAIVFRRDGREVGRERVLELRGALHHYGPAASGVLATTGQVLSGALDEAASPGAAPITLLDGAALARLAEQHGVLVLSTRIELPIIDVDLLEALRS